MDKTALQKAIEAAKARKAAKAAGLIPEKTSGTKVSKTDADRKAAREKLEAERAERTANKALAAAAKRLAREAERKPAHMGKVLKAAEKLPILDEFAAEAFTNLTESFGEVELAALALHLQHFNRVSATQRALGVKIAEGDVVEIVGGDPRHIGLVGVVTKAQRIRCYVEVDGIAKELYLFTSDVARKDVESEDSDEDIEREAIVNEATGTDG